MADQYVLFGGGGHGSFSAVVDVFKVDGDTLSAVTDHGLALSEARGYPAAASCGNYILFAGGWGFFDTVDVFHVTASGVEAVTGHGLSLSEARAELAAARVGNYIVFGGGWNGSFSAVVDVFKVDGDTLSAVTDHGLALSEARDTLAAASCGNYILFAGGEKQTGVSSSVIDIFKVNSDGTFETVTHNLSLSQARRGLAAARVGNYIVFGGGWNDYSSPEYFDTVDVFHVTANGIEAVTDHGLSLSAPRGGLAAATIGNHVLFAGGWDATDSESNVVDVFKVTENGVEAVTGHGLSLSQPRADLAGASIGNYAVFAGGYANDSYFNTVDVFQAT